MHKTFNGTDWSEAVVIDEEEERTGASLNGIGIDSIGNIHISYWDWNRDGTDDSWLKYGYFDGSTWTVETLQSIMDKESPTRHSSLALDSSDNPHISYYDPKNQTLRYTYHDGSSWVDQNLTQDDANDNGRHNSIALDSSDYPRISYKNSTATTTALSDPATAAPTILRSTSSSRSSRPPPAMPPSARAPPRVLRSDDEIVRTLRLARASPPSACRWRARGRLADHPRSARAGRGARG